MKKIRELTEAKNTIVFAFGRFNPPTTGHEKLIQKTVSVAGTNPWRIYPSFTQNPKKDPLPHALKVAYMRKMFSKYKRNIIADADAKTAIMIAEKLYKEGFKNLVMVAGSDRIKEFSTLLNRYNDAPDKRGNQLFKFDSVDVVSAGERDPDSEGVEGMSASKMRAAAVDGDIDSFLKGVPSGFDDGKKLYRDVRKYMGIREERDMGDMTDFETVRDMYLTGKIWNAGDIVETNGIVGEVVRKGTNYLSFVDEDGKVHKAWLHDIDDFIVEGLTMMVKSKKQKYQLAGGQKIKVDGVSYETEGVTKMQVLVLLSGRNQKVMSKKEIEDGLKSGNVQIVDTGKVWQPEESEFDEAKSPLQKLIDFDKSRVAAGKKPIFKDKEKDKKKEEYELDERNYRKEYDNYQGRPEQIARRSSRNKARRIMGDKTKIGMDVGHADNDPMNNDPKNLRNEDPSKNRREPRLREEETLDEMPWYTKFSNWVNIHSHKRAFNKLAKEYVDRVTLDKEYKGKYGKAINDIARETNGVSRRELRDHINTLIKKGIIPQELRLDFDPSEEKISSFKEFIDQINNK